MIIERAKEILRELESGNSSIQPVLNPRAQEQDEQLSLMPDVNSALSEKLSKADLNTLTPIEAMNLLYELKNLL